MTHPLEIRDDDEERLRLSDLNGAVLTYETADGDTRTVEFDDESAE